MESKARPRVLVVRGGAIGDFILTLPAIRLIRESIPGCHLEVIGYPGIADLSVKAGLAEAVRNFEHRTMAPLFAVGAPIDEGLVAYLCSFNLVVSYLYDPDQHFRNSLQRVGVKTLIECRHQVEPGRGHAAAQLARPLEALAMYLEEGELRAPLFAADREPGERRRVVIHPGSGSTKKNWSLANWLEVGRWVADRPGTELVVVTGEAELERGITEEIRVAWRDVRFQHWDHVPLVELADRLGGCDLFLGHDSGVSHLAAACGVACVLLFGPTEPEVWAPPQDGVTVIRAPEGDLIKLMPETVLEHLQSRLSP